MEKEEKINSIADLPGVGAVTLQKLMDMGYHSLWAIAASSPKQLSDVTGMTEANARKLITKARENVDFGLKDSIIIKKERENMEKISTGYEGLDKIIGGGIELGSITEAYGEFGSCKSYLAHILAVQSIIKGNSVIYVDSEGSFRPENIEKLLNNNTQNLTPEQKEEMMKRVKVAKVFGSDHQIVVCEQIEKDIRELGNVKLIIVDSLTEHFRHEMQARGSLADRQQKLNAHMHQLLKLACQYNLAVFVTNQVMANPSGMMFGDPTVPVGGHIVGHASKVRLYLKKSKKGTRMVKLVDAPHLPDNEIRVKITDKGFEEAEE